MYIIKEDVKHPLFYWNKRPIILLLGWKTTIWLCPSIILNIQTTTNAAIVIPIKTLNNFLLILSLKIKIGIHARTSGHNG